LIDNYAGPEADLEGKQLRAEWELWRSTRMTDEPQAPGRNVPEEIEEDSAPF
jgi:hypothetical protein